MKVLKTRTEYLKILEFSVNAKPSVKEIKQQYRKLSFDLHPDKGGDTKKYQDICEAKDALISNTFAVEKIQNKQEVPVDFEDRLVSKITSFLDDYSDKVYVKDNKIIFKLINNNLICIKIETDQDKVIMINNHPIKIQHLK